MKYLILFLCLISPLAYGEEINWSKLLNSVATIESSNNPNAYNERTGATGKYQITEICLKEFNEKSHYIARFTMNNMYNEELSRTVALWYLKRLKDHYKAPSIEAILAGYNRGPTYMRKHDWNIKMSPEETRNYVIKVMAIYKELK